MQAYRLYLVGAVSLLLTLAACQPIRLEQAMDAHGENSAALVEQDEAEVMHEEIVHWAYEGEGGPEHWGEISPDYTACADGSAQSPIDLSDAVGEDLTDIVFNYNDSALNILNNGHTVQVNYAEGSSIMVDDLQYDLLQFHFHAASEHTIAGEQYPLEFHLVHRNAEGGLAVVGVMAVEGAENPAFAEIIANAPAEETAAMMVEGIMVAAESLLPAGRLYFAYSGSLTTPPCSEAVKWHVLSTPIEMSAAQISSLAGILYNNFRPVQPLSARVLKVDTTSNQLASQ